MNPRKLIYLFILLVLAACSGKNKRSDAYGTFEATEVTISSEISGKLLTFKPEEGLELKEGEEIAVIDTADLYLKKKVLEAQQKVVASKLTTIGSQAEIQQQQKENLLVEKSRLEKLLADKAATPKQMDDLTASLKVVEKQIKATETQQASIRDEQDGIAFQIAQLELSLKKCHIMNPVKGTVLVTYAEPSELTTTGKPLYKLANLEEMFLRVYISGDQLAHVKLGQTVEVLIDEDKENNRKLSGVVSWISSTAEFTPKIIQTKEERVNLVYAMKVRVKNDGSLKIAMPGEVNFK